MSQPWYKSLFNSGRDQDRRGFPDGMPGHPPQRRLAGWLLGGVMLAAGSPAWPLGLGEIELDSALNERLDADIELYDAQGLQPTEIIVSLASADDFERVGVERFFFLTDLRFEVDLQGSTVRGIRVTSTQPVTEPYLNFLVEVLWPKGRLLKEYTLLLDPPTFSPAAAPAVAAPDRAVAQDGGAGRVQRAPAAPQRSSAGTGTRVQLAPEGRDSGPSPLDEGVVDGEYRMTDRNDTLWTIAQRTLPSQSVSVKQNMLAIQRLNPEAFMSDNINLLKAGYRLKLPSEQQALSVSSADAERQVAMQNEDWRSLQNGDAAPRRTQVAAVEERDTAAPLQAQIDATPAAAAGAAPAAAGDGQLRIVAGGGDSVTGPAEGDGQQASAGELTAAMEERDRLNREVGDLTEELSREKELASNQLAVKDRQLEIRDQQIADMQTQIERMRAELEQREAAAPQSQNQNASSTQPWWQSPLALGAAVGVVVLLLVYALITARRRRAEADAYQAEFEEEPAFAAAAAEAETEGAATAVAEGAIAELTPDADETAPAEAVEAEADTLEFDLTESAEDDATVRAEDSAPVEGAETGDVIGEADIYIAYGRYPQAIGLLLGVLEDAPDRNDVRLKLLELYAETRDREAFDEHMAELTARCDDHDALHTARELAAQFGGVAEPQEAPVSLDELPGDFPGGEEPMAALAGDEDDVPEADAAIEYEPSLPSATDQADAPAVDPMDDEFELELDDIADAAADEGTAHGNDLGGDLGIDFDPDRLENGSAAGIDLTEDALGELDEALGDDLAGDLAGDREPAPELERQAASNGLEMDIDLEGMDALGDDAFDFDDDGDTASTKLDLARAYIDMGDQDGARDILNEVVAEGSSEQQQRAQAMLEEL